MASSSSRPFPCERIVECRESFCEESHLHGTGAADRRGGEGGRSAVRHETDLGERKKEVAGLRSDSEVACERQGYADTRGGSVDCIDDRTGNARITATVRFAASMVAASMVAAVGRSFVVVVDRSAPVQNAPPAPVRTAARTAESPARDSKASVIASTFRSAPHSCAPAGRGW
ncbi:hypothetical protein Pd630_LPD04442 [Rhodococcus opacus PD630]|nr:hypothetical protein Pd630_LPD04442 [Rhodococcus opacus PD630]